MKKNAFTLVELIVALFILSAILAATFATFITLSKSFKSETKLTETQIEDVLGLNILRYDLEMAGYGLPWTLPGAPSPAISEAASDGTYTVNPNTFNDAAPNAPRAVIISNNAGDGGSDVLVIKSLVATTGNTSSTNSLTKKYTVRYKVAGVGTTQTWNDTTRDFQNGDKVIVLNTGTSPPVSRTLQQQAGCNWYTTWPGSAACFDPGSATDVNLIYGLSTTTPRMPYNRVDYFLKRPASFSSKCHQSSYTLYRGVINQSDGKRTEQPIMDCVLDFQAALGLNIAGALTWVSASGAVGSATDLTTAANVRSYLREVKVFILLQDGQFDKDFTYASSSVVIGDSNITLRNYDLTALTNYQNYKWKVVTLDAKTVNLN
ncbi:MAG: prepilin-type N-terminal cleavage/methylation domain-containing protein [Nitrospirae bacterium]|nr:prepilin-type N-terminal cleavage/methylation domain-containing protein [Nitrospirota bacterium]MBF0519209.1 prepilin-type N-terminal cleavage/methylation domain-containing protein [Nitrospirota bacterium]